MHSSSRARSVDVWADVGQKLEKRDGNSAVLGGGIRQLRTDEVGAGVGEFWNGV